VGSEAESRVIVAARQWRMRFSWLFAAVWLFYLAEPMAAAWNHPEMATRLLGEASLIAFALVYMWLFGFTRQDRRSPGRLPSRQAAFGILTLLLLAALSIPAAGPASQATLVYVAAAAVLRLPTPYGWGLVGVMLAGIVIVGRLLPGWDTGGGLIFGVFVAALAVWGVGQLVQRNIQLVAAQEEIARLAVTEERARAARDLHDILGHSLTVITVKAELAGRLMPADPERAALEIADVEALAREALADVRSTMTAQRSVTLVTELASARVALEAAGIETELPMVTDPVIAQAAADNGELFGWVIREGVTNVVRHSGAQRCTIVIGRDRVEIVDDGRGPVDEGGTAGHGLDGLRQRAATAGASITVGRAGRLGGFRLVVGATS
jgi:two-component system sensor histidine kinase DesK